MGLTESIFRELIYYPVAAVQAGPVRRYQAQLEESQFWPEDRLREFQRSRLRDLVEHARQNVPHYSDRIPARFGSPGDLPCLTKADLQRFADQLTSTAAVGRLVAKTTGGSTGEPVTVWKTRDAWARELAATWRGYSWAGVSAGDLQARFWGVPQRLPGRLRARIIDFVSRRIRLSAFSFSRVDMDHYVDVLERRRPRYFYGYVSMLTEFARFLDNTGRRLHFDPVCVITTAEVLTPADRELLQEVFRTRVFNEYGCGELGTIAHECPEGRLHLCEENMLVEILEGDRCCGAGEVGELVVTELNNIGFPMIRYRTGDFGSVSAEPCGCGRTLTVLEDVQGRAYDFVRNRKGELFHGEFIMYIFEELRSMGSGIQQFQVIQEDYDRFRVRIVKDAAYRSESEEFIRERICSKVDAQSTVEFDYVERIERERSGKLRLIKGLGVDRGEPDH